MCAAGLCQCFLRIQGRRSILTGRASGTRRINFYLVHGLLRKDFLDDVAADVGQAVVAALEAERQLEMVQTQQMQQCGLQVVDVDDVFDRVVTEFVGVPDRLPAFDAATGQPHGKTIDVMVAADQVSRFALRRATELAAPDDDGVVEQTALLKVSQ